MTSAYAEIPALEKDFVVDGAIVMDRVLEMGAEKAHTPVLYQLAVDNPRFLLQ